MRLSRAHIYVLFLFICNLLTYRAFVFICQPMADTHQLLSSLSTSNSWQSRLTIYENLLRYDISPIFPHLSFILTPDNPIYRIDHIQLSAALQSSTEHWFLTAIHDTIESSDAIRESSTQLLAIFIDNRVVALNSHLNLQLRDLVKQVCMLTEFYHPFFRKLHLH